MATSTLSNKSTGYLVPEGHGCKLLGTSATQKGRGVLAISAAGYQVPAFGIAQKPLDIARVLNALFKHGYPDGQFEVFVRPMPVQPWHGFVDSRVCHSTAEIMQVWQETIDEDPQGEIMIMKAIDARLNMVIHPGAIIIGAGNDGATAGHNCIEIPLVGKIGNKWRSLATQATVKVEEWPFFELVVTGKQKNETIWWTQLRGGPPIPRGDHYIPKPMTIEHVQEAVGNLVEWKVICNKMLANTAVWHPEGSLGSHYGVHCIENKIAIFTKEKDKPEVGKFIEPTKALPDRDLDALRTGIIAGTLVDLTNSHRRGPGVQYVLMCMHSAPFMREQSAFWFGAACSIMHRLGVAASLGEWRHATRLASGAASKTMFSGWNRDQVYNKAFPEPFPHRKLLPAAFYSFAHGKWGGSFGGKKWAECAGSIVALDEAMMQVLTKPSQQTATELVNALNESVDKAHNNGWWMNKFVAAAAFNEAAAHEFSTIQAALPIVIELLGIGEQRLNLELLARRWLLARRLPDGAKVAEWASSPDGEGGWAVPAPTVVKHTTIEHVQVRVDHTEMGTIKNLHFQIKTDGHQEVGGYATTDLSPEGLLIAPAKLLPALLQLPPTTSLAGSATTYYVMDFKVLDLKQGVFTIQLNLLGEPLTTIKVAV